MSALLHMFRSPRKLVVLIGGVALLIGSSGAFALYLGKDRLQGFVSASPNGLECSDVSLITIRKENRFWVRKYIRTDPTDGLTRVKTALRVAKAVYEEQKPDLVQVVVLDKNGPTLRSDIRGRALGADVVYVPHPDKVAGGAVEAPVTARYYNGGASAQGLFYGEQINMLPTDIDETLAALKNYSDCDNPLAAENEKGDAKTDKRKAAMAAEEKAAAKEAAHAPPKPHEPATTGNVPPETDKGDEFIGVDATDPKAAPPLGLDPTMTGASSRPSPVTN
ncbi:hypothetical protein G6L94_15890 [Agrobacterium rhizogenes]|uniref:hypothetical protein n=1 Tax=Rhizobium TaxID=379 RepID=UPI00026EE2AF|nr:MULTISPECIES: hypothetical protein [Rhizobium]KAA6484392.1 hypothetical protein DXT98_21695 [Agrobacterium sp. ICMP 7243]OCI92067.1 hypothetical protein A6U85_21570 [Agrobacterium sp. 13-626]OCJ16877.1 hypothetical protein A6U89_18550 [Agrobacterium sp. B133/95]EJK79601.1 hypothetical protein PMI03_05252 [Rhizobium sp. AP16]KEA05646.1 hypothetical protein CN09_01340 [Rhizobium rhizogenes]